jgi:hypothetical protein
MLGMARQPVAALVGPPDRIEDHSHDDEASVDWHYDQRGFSLYFDAEEDFRLNLVLIDLPSVELAGKRPIGMTEDEAQNAFAEMWGFALEYELSDLGVKTYELGDTEISLSFERGVCDSVQVAAHIDESDQYVWPTS